MKKKKSKRKIASTSFVLALRPYPFDVFVTLGTTKEYVHSFIEKRLKYKLSRDEKEAVSCDSQGQTVQMESGAIVMWTKKLPSDPTTTAILVHEIFHVVDMLFNKIGIRLSESSDEAYSYMIEYITREILSTIK